MAQIAVEDSLTNIKETLQNSGFQVIPLQSENLSQCDCCIISGQDQNFMGMQDVVAQIPVINASGMTAEQVLQEVQERTAQAAR